MNSRNLKAIFLLLAATLEYYYLGSTIHKSLRRH